MKIIKLGSLPEEKEYHCKCVNCATHFSFLKQEGHVVYDQRDGDYIEINCPLCKIVCVVTMRYDYHDR